jgi:hypothetical protein
LESTTSFRLAIPQSEKPMSSTPSVSALVEHLQAGHREAAQQFWEACYPRLVALTRKKLGGTARRVADEEDVALSAFDSFCRNAAEKRVPCGNTTLPDSSRKPFPDGDVRRP